MTQKEREAEKFSFYARGDQQIPSNPFKELDELYYKDNKTAQVDLETFANAHIKKEEEEQFNNDMMEL